MFKFRSLVAGTVAIGAVVAVQGAGFVDAVVGYVPGEGYATEFGSGIGYTNTLAVLGAPSTRTPGPFGGPVDPFSPPYLSEQLLSVGAGGSLTVQLSAPVVDLGSNPFGLDFIIFGSSGFVITNGVFSGGGITDGTLFGASAGATRVSVSADNVTYFTLDASLAPGVDGFAPTDGEGDPHRAVDPSMPPDSFTGSDLMGIRTRYAGSAGGTGFDLAWARDPSGLPVVLDPVRYVRIEVMEGSAEIDAIATVADGQVVVETFDRDPVETGWLTFGDPALFAWDAQAQALRATWDSARPNSYFHIPLKRTLGPEDDFEFGFDLTLRDVAIGLRPATPYTFQLATGLLKLSDATLPEFRRGTGSQSPNLVEFDYFPDSGFGATVSPVIVSGSNQFHPGFTFPMELSVGDRFRVSMSFSAVDQTLSTRILRNGEPLAPVETVQLPAGFTGFELDAFAVSSFNESGADGSILAHGLIDNIVLAYPDGPVSRLSGRLEGDAWRCRFLCRSGWNYQLERSLNLGEWTRVGEPKTGTGGWMELGDPGRASDRGFYRIRGERP